jgi:ABC-type branched-subunit amino acid transport system substrate-binding protein
LAAPARRGLAALALGVLVGLGACAPQSPVPGFVGVAPPLGQPAAAVTRAALLLPLTGSNAPLGQAMLNASTMALFDEAPTGVEFLPRDTGGTASGAAAAARAAIADGARALVGPLTSAEAAAVGPVARAAGVPMLAFTNDAQRAAPGAWVLGITPQQQMRRVVAAASREGAQNFVLAAPNTEFGRALAEGMRSATSDLGLPRPTIALHPANADPAMAAGAARVAAPQADALVLGESGDRARRFALAFASEARAAQTGMEALPGQGPLLLGTAQWLNDPSLRAEGALVGARFPGPDAGARARFEQRYREAFRDTPQRVAAAAYDAAALAARALRSGASVDGVTALRSFDGAEGPVRLLADGRTLRGLAIYALSSSGEAMQVESAPEPVGTGF